MVFIADVNPLTSRPLFTVELHEIGCALWSSSHQLRELTPQTKGWDGEQEKLSRCRGHLRSPPWGGSSTGTSGSGWEFSPRSFLRGREAFPLLGARSHGIFRCRRKGAAASPPQDVTALISSPLSLIYLLPRQRFRLFLPLPASFPRPLAALPSRLGLSSDLRFMGSAGARPCCRVGGLLG